MANLPAWGQDDLPEPLPYSWRNALRTVGPGAILLATSIGGGEWLVGPSISVRYGVGVMWVATLGIVLQVLFNLEAIRYTLYTGEPILSGIMRLKPGANFWGTAYVVMAIVQLGVPALGLACAAVLLTALTGELPGPGDQAKLTWLTYLVLLATLAVLSLGGTVERTLERVSWAMIAYIMVFLTFVNVAFVPFAHSRETLGGFFQFGRLPSGMDWTWLAALAATAGSGGIGNLTITNWVRDKGFGMGARVGAIPSAVGGRQIELSHNGKVFPLTDANRARWKTWWRFIVLDQAWLWGAGCFVGMYLNVNLATAITPAGTDLNGEAAGAFQAQYMAERMWRGLWYLGLLNGFWILFSTHLGNTDILVRTITDVTWVASARLRAAPKLGVGRVYFSVLLLCTAWNAVAVHLGSAMQLFKFLASIAAIVMVPASLQILRINTTLLPPELRPSWWRRAALVACAAFYATVSLFVVKKLLMA